MAEGVVPVAAVGPDAFLPGPGAVPVRLALGAGAAWVVDTVPVLGVDEVDGFLEATLAVGGTAWLERLLLQLGSEAPCSTLPSWWEWAPGRHGACLSATAERAWK